MYEGITVKRVELVCFHLLHRLVLTAHISRANIDKFIRFFWYVFWFEQNFPIEWKCNFIHFYQQNHGFWCQQRLCTVNAEKDRHYWRLVSKRMANSGSIGNRKNCYFKCSTKASKIFRIYSLWSEIFSLGRTKGVDCSSETFRL